jgi:hypothetical protein
MGRSLALCVLFVSLSGSVGADPITTGTWSVSPPPQGNGFPFYDGRSFDCDECGVAYWLPAGIEYLNDGAGRAVAFGFSRFPGATLFLQQTAWRNGTLNWDRDSGDFVYDTGTGYSYRSLDGIAMALFRNRRGGDVDYWLAVEDLPMDWPVQDRDFNDAVFMWTARIPGTEPEPEPAPTPEPGTLLLLSAGALAIRKRHSRSRRLRQFR